MGAEVHGPGVSYHEWQAGSVVVGATRVRFATKPGAFAHGTVDAASLLLAERVAVRDGDVVLQLNCGAGLFGVAAALAGSATRVWMSDRNCISADAAMRTIGLNAVSNATALLGQGTSVFPPEIIADVVAIRLPHEKIATLQLLHDAWRALRVGGICAIAGATNEGAKSAAKLLDLMFGNGRVVSSAGGVRLVTATKLHDSIPSHDELFNAYLDHETFRQIDATLRGLAFTLASRPGVFSWEHVDEATNVLAQQMIIPHGARVLELGCGSGALGLVAARQSDTGPVTMLDADAEAVRSANRSAQLSGVKNCEALCSDIANAVLDEQFEVVISNPPFHVGKATALNVPRQFMRDARTVLRVGGTLQLVANRTLPYEAELQQLFGNVQTVHDGARFKVLSATKSQSA